MTGNGMGVTSDVRFVVDYDAQPERNGARWLVIDTTDGEVVAFCDSNGWATSVMEALNEAARVPAEAAA